MSVTNQLLSTVQDATFIPVDLRYTNFLHALQEIRDETMRNHCHQAWTSLYQYFDRSITSERTLALEEKRTREILHRLQIEMTSRQAEIAYQVRHILQRGHRVLTDLHLKYNEEKNSLTTTERNIDDLETKTKRQKSESSMRTLLHTDRSSTSQCPMRTMIDDLKLQIRDLYNTREILQIQLNTNKTNYVSMQIQAYHVQQNLRQAEKELAEVQHELTLNLHATQQRDSQLNEFLHYTHTRIDPDYSNIDCQSVSEEQLKNEQTITLELKKQNKELNNTLLRERRIIKMHEDKQTQLNINNRKLIEMIEIKREEFVKEKEIKQNISRLVVKLQMELKRQKHILFIHTRQRNKLKTQLVQLEYQRDQCYPHSSNSSLDSIHQSTNIIQTDIQQKLQDRLQLTIIHHHRKSEINTLEHTTKHYALLVKEQRQKIINYEKRHDSWIRHMTRNRHRLLELFHRLDQIEQHVNDTNKFFQQFNRMELSSLPKILTLENDINVYIEHRKEKDHNMNMNITDESQSSLHLKLSLMKKTLHSNQRILHQINQNISSVTHHYSLLSNQLSAIAKQRSHVTDYLITLDNKYLVEQQQILNLINQFDQIKLIIDLNNHKYQRLTEEKQSILLFLLKKQRLIVLINDHIQMNENNLTKHRSCYNQLLNEIQQIRNQVLCTIPHTKPSRKDDQSDLKQLLLRLQNEFIESKKKTNNFAHRKIINESRRKSIRKGNNDQCSNDLEQKALSIIYRLICKTHYNIILHKRLDILIERTFVLDHIEQRSLKKSCMFYMKNSLKTEKQCKSYTAELRILKNEILIYQRIYVEMKYSLMNASFV